MNQPPSRSRPAEGGSKSGYRFDVAASFASEDRPLVTEIVDALKEKGVRVFYDEDYQLAGSSAACVEPIWHRVADRRDISPCGSVPLLRTGLAWPGRTGFHPSPSHIRVPDDRSA